MAAPAQQLCLREPHGTDAADRRPLPWQERLRRGSIACDGVSAGRRGNSAARVVSDVDVWSQAESSLALLAVLQALALLLTFTAAFAGPTLRRVGLALDRVRRRRLWRRVAGDAVGGVGLPLASGLRTLVGTLEVSSDRRGAEPADDLAAPASIWLLGRAAGASDVLLRLDDGTSVALDGTLSVLCGERPVQPGVGTRVRVAGELATRAAPRSGVGYRQLAQTWAFLPGALLAAEATARRRGVAAGGLSTRLPRRPALLLWALLAALTLVGHRTTYQTQQVVEAVTKLGAASAERLRTLAVREPCADTVACRTFGHCSFDRLERRCRARRAADCRASQNCPLFGECQLIGGWCDEPFAAR